LSIWAAWSGVPPTSIFSTHAFRLPCAALLGFGSFKLLKSSWRRSARIGILPAGLSFQERLDLLHAVEEGADAAGGDGKKERSE